MKKQFSYSIFAAFIILPCLVFGQGGSPGNTRFGPANFLGYATTAGTAGSLDIRNDWNQQILFGTNGFNRMLIDNGGGLQNGGRIAIGNNLPAGFNPSARLHIHQIAATTNSITPFIRFTTPVTGTTNTDGFAIGNTTQATVGNNGEVHLIQYEQEPIIISAPNTNTNYLGPQPAEVFRIQNGKMVGLPISAAFRSSDGYVGLNQTNPRAHIEMVTTAFTGGEEFFMAKPSDLPGADVQMGMMNLTAADNFFLPGMFGNINQSNQTGTALSLLGCIPSAQDLSGNPPVMRFAVGKNWIINQNTPIPVGSLPVTNAVVTRPLFSWENSGGIYMFMAANGRLRIGYNSILSNPNLIPQRPNNRIEITADVIDPYFNPNGNPAGNPIYAGITAGSGSGLRFTYLTSRDLVITPDATNQIDPSKVLSVDKNGDVVAIYPALGAVCTNTLQIAGQAFTASRAINQNNFNMEWRNGRNGFGTNSCTVGNRVEITGLTSFSATPGGNSGLRFTNLTSTTTAVSNPSLGVLSVNANGDVIYVNAGGGATLGNVCGTATPNPLPNDWEIPLNNKNFVFSEQAATGNYTNNNVGIGTSCAPAAKLEVISKPTTNTVNPITIKTFNNDLASGTNFTGDAFGQHTIVNNQNLNNRGYYSEVNQAQFNFGYVANVSGNWAGISSNNNTENTGVFSFAANSTKNIGVYGIAEDGISYPNSECTGGLFHGRLSPNTNIGVGGLAGGPLFTNPPYSLVSTDVAVFGNVANTNSINYAGYFVGDVFINGNGYLPGFVPITSDQLFKTNIDTIANVMSILKQLKPKTFYFDTTNTYGIRFSSRKQYGLIAQDVEAILPELVGKATKPAEADSTGNVVVPSVTYKNLNYNAFIAFLIKGMQVQQKTIDSLTTKTNKQDSINNAVQAQIAALTSSVTSCCSSTAIRSTKPEELNQLDIKLSDKDIIVLNQNVPNPFAEQTTITYNVPEKYNFAQIVFSTIEGKIIKAVDITKKGKGQLNVFANDLSTGFYTYSLIVDGKTIDTKKMVKSE